MAPTAPLQPITRNYRNPLQLQKITELQLQHFQLLQHVGQTATLHVRPLLQIALLQLPQLPKLPQELSGVDDISDNSQDSHPRPILILIILIISLIDPHFSINYRL
ncbi:MAG: hypothetical protein JNM70_04490 [Anaerolineae bacterium]|nr:hypothetical protein [Anaerolineae bacterium]